jgi:hypothetical protein
MSRIKYQHYVPRFYLERFCDAQGMVWVFDKSLGKSYRRRPSEVGGETYYYDVPKLDEHVGVEQFVEKFFQPVEAEIASIFAVLLRKLESGSYFKIYDEQRNSLAVFLALQLIRTPSHRLFALQMRAEIEKLGFKAYLQHEHPELAEKDFEVTWDKKRESFFHAQRILDMDSLKRVAGVLYNHIWTVVENDSAKPLYTSDSPVVRKAHGSGGWRSHYGIASRGIQLMFPLSPRFSLNLLEYDRWKKVEKFDGKVLPLRMNEEIVQHDNSGQVQESMRFLYCSGDDFDLARDMCERFPDLADPKRRLVSVG